MRNLERRRNYGQGDQRQRRGRSTSVAERLRHEREEHSRVEQEQAAPEEDHRSRPAVDADVGHERTRQRGQPKADSIRDHGHAKVDDEREGDATDGEDGDERHEDTRGSEDAVSAPQLRASAQDTAGGRREREEDEHPPRRPGSDQGRPPQ